MDRTLTTAPDARPAALPLGAAEDAARASRARRWLALDLFRFLAVVLMVQGHAFYVTASPAVREAGWYAWHNYVHGFTAPMFLFAAGLAFAITTFRRWDEHTRLGRPVYRRIERYLLLLAIGYLLQVPGLSLGKLLSPDSPDALARMLKVDALHHIGLVLLLCVGLVLVLRRPGRFAFASGALGVASVLAGPFVWRLPAEEVLPTFLAAWVNDHTGSIFPLVPWSGFIFAGVVTGWAVSRAARRDGDWTSGLPPRLAGVAAVLLATGFALDQSGLDPFGPHNFWKTSPWFFLWRLGVVVLVLALLGLLDGWLRARTSRPTVRLIRVMGQETLVVYVAHLLVLYGSPVFVGVWALWRRQLGLAPSVAVVVALFAAMAGLAQLWHHVKTRRPSEFQWLRLGLMALTIAVLLAPR